ncbi:MAG: Pr6Pr family membrane protein [Flavobacterium sp.]|nr:Pr6Pr family membrane protein [Flavobacterium sp.]
MNIKIKKLLIPIISVLASFAVLLQFYLIIVNRADSISETFVRFFSFFTIQTNILVAVSFGFLWLQPKSKAGVFFSNPKNSTAITLYITIVGLVYNEILRYLWAPTGLQKIADEILHLIVPVLVLAYWYLYVSQNKLAYKVILSWLAFPFGYLVYILIRGAIAMEYPYPFLEVTALGYSQVFINCFMMLIAFLVIGVLLIGICKMRNKKAN